MYLRTLGNSGERGMISLYRVHRKLWTRGNLGVYMDHTSARLPTTYNSTDHMYVSRNLRTIYSPAVTGSYFLGFPVPEQWGKHEISASELGLQKKAIDCRLGMTASKSFSRDWGATTRWRVERKTSLLQRARRSETFTTIVPG